MKIIIKINTFIKKQITDVNTYGIRELFRKFYLLIKFLAVILLDIIAIVPCLIIRLISPWFIIRIEKISAGNFGNFVWMTAMYYCKKKLNINQPKRKHIDLLYINPTSKIYNKQIEKMWKRKLKIYPSFLLDPIRTANRFIPGWRNHIIENLSVTQRDINNLFEKCQVLDFTIEEEIYGKKVLNKFGLKDKDKFVCLAVRDGAYQLKKISSRFRDWSYQDHRHTDVDKFMLAAEELAKRGYFVFRMGVVVEKPFNSKNSKIIDYANSNLRSDFMDVYLGAKCSFCISTEFGFETLPCIFRKPLVQLNQPLGGAYTYNEKYLLMTKHHVLKKEKRKLTLSEIFSHGVGYANDSKIYEQKGIELKENSSEEIRDIVIEMDEYLKNNKELSGEEKELQKTFKDLYASNLKRYSHQNNIDTQHGTLTHGEIRSRYSTQFLKKNRDWLR